MPELALTPAMMVLMGLLGLVIVLFVTERLRVDVVALLALVSLGLLSQVPGLQSLATAESLYRGFSSNAVIAIIGVMILSAGLDRSGVMRHLADLLVRLAGRSESRVLTLVGMVAATISSFMQNIGAVALLMPAVSRVAHDTGAAASRILMPLGFAAILGGTVTLMGSSPLILLNDLLPDGVEPFGLFDTAPVGLSLVAVGLAFLVLFGRRLLPQQSADAATPERMQDHFQHNYGLDWQACEVNVQALDSVDGGLNVRQFEERFDVHLIALRGLAAPVLSPRRDIELHSGDQLTVIGDEASLLEIAHAGGFQLLDNSTDIATVMHNEQGGIAELVIPPGSRLIGRSLDELWMRHRYGLAVLAQHSRGKTVDSKIRKRRLAVGDALICHVAWANLEKLEASQDFVIVTGGYPRTTTVAQRAIPALGFFVLALALALFSDLKLGVALLTGALGMILTGVLSIDDAYKAVSWKTVFLLAGLIPLGIAMEQTGTAAWIAQQAIGVLGQPPAWLLLGMLALLATGFTLVMSNVGATVLLIPLAVGLADSTGLAAQQAALVVAIAVSNSFAIPTHQVNALIMEPGGYRVRDYLRVGGIMSALFLITAVTAILLWY